MQSRNVPLLLCLFYALALAGFAQTPAAAPVDNAFVQKEFSITCTVLPGAPPIVADFDGDGIDDIAIPAKCTNPMMDQAENSFKVVDPYNDFFGYGDPKITNGFASEDPDFRGRSLLIIHGAGPEAWRSEKPKAKFVIINLPFKQLRARKMFVKKKAVTAIYAEEASADDMTSSVFWDGRKYRYEPLGSNLE
jgi:hypothetical protein